MVKKIQKSAENEMKGVEKRELVVKKRGWKGNSSNVTTGSQNRSRVRHRIGN